MYRAAVFCVPDAFCYSNSMNQTITQHPLYRIITFRTRYTEYQSTVPCGAGHPGRCTAVQPWPRAATRQPLTSLEPPAAPLVRLPTLLRSRRLRSRRHALLGAPRPVLPLGVTPGARLLLERAPHAPKIAALLIRLLEDREERRALLANHLPPHAEHTHTMSIMQDAEHAAGVAPGPWACQRHGRVGTGHEACRDAGCMLRSMSAVPRTAAARSLQDRCKMDAR